MPGAGEDTSTLTQPFKKLSLQTAPKSAKSPKKKSTAVVADSWEDNFVDENDEDDTASDSSGARTETEATVTSNPTSRPSTSSSSSYPSAPPPTPSSPSFPVPAQDQLSSFPSSSLSSATNGSSERKVGSASARGERRPETSMATASRMIAAGLGVKAPKRTEEQREYDRTVREKEKKRLEREKAETVKMKEAAEKARMAIWES